MGVLPCGDWRRRARLASTIAASAIVDHLVPNPDLATESVGRLGFGEQVNDHETGGRSFWAFPWRTVSK